MKLCPRTNGANAALALTIGVLLGVGLLFVGLHSAIPAGPIVLADIVLCAGLVCVLIADFFIRGADVIDYSKIWFKGLMVDICLFGVLVGFLGAFSVRLIIGS